LILRQIFISKFSRFCWWGYNIFCTRAQSNFSALLFGRKPNFSKRQSQKEVCSQREEFGPLQTFFRQWERGSDADVRTFCFNNQDFMVFLHRRKCWNSTDKGGRGSIFCNFLRIFFM